MDSSRLGEGPAAGSCEHDKEISVVIKCGEFLYQDND